MLYNCKGVIFDFNGTLFFDSDKHVLAWGQLAEILTGEKLSLTSSSNTFTAFPTIAPLNNYWTESAPRKNYLDTQSKKNLCTDTSANKIKQASTWLMARKKPLSN